MSSTKQNSAVEAVVNDVLADLYAKSGCDKVGLARESFAAILCEVGAKHATAATSGSEIRTFLLTLRVDELALARACAEEQRDEFMLIVAPLVLPEFWRRFLTEILIWGLLAMSSDLLIGYTGLVSFGHSAFFGLGMYGAAAALAIAEAAIQARRCASLATSWSLV